MEPFVINGRVDVEQLRALLAAQSEYPTLDYKLSCDLSEGKGRAEFIKDCAAMMSNPQGGYLVVGVDGHGTPAGAKLDAQAYDSAKLGSILAKYLEGEVPVISQVHHLADGDVAVIYLGRRPNHLFPIVKADMTYVDANGKTQTPLRAGDVFVREGTRSRRWRSPDLPALLAPYADRIRDEEQQRYGRIVSELTARQQDSAIAHGPISNVTWQLPDETFTLAVTELSRTRDDRGLRLLLLSIGSAGKALAPRAAPGTAEFTDLMTMLDRLTTCLGVGLVTGDDDLVARATKALHGIYLSVGVEMNPTSATEPRIWLEIAARILGAIALAVRLEEWNAIPGLALQPVGKAYIYQSWLRHADVWASRTDQSSQLTDAGAVPGLLIAVARERVAAIPALRPDLVGADSPPPLGAQPDRDDPGLDSLCQADFLWCVIAATRGRGIGEQYPSFAALYPHRTEPIVDQIRSDPSLAQVLLPDLNPDRLREVIDAVLDVARSQGRFW